MPVPLLLLHQGTVLSRMVNKTIITAETLQDIEDAMDEWGSSFTVINVATAFNRAAKLAARNPGTAMQLLDRLAITWDALLPLAEQRQLANVLWACGKLKYSHPQLWSSSLAAFMQQLQQPSDERGQHIAIVMYAMAMVASVNSRKVPGMQSDVVKALVVELCGQLRVLVMHPQQLGVTSQHVSNTMWACAKLRISPGSAVLDSLLTGISRPNLLAIMESQHLGNTLWAVSELQHECGWQPNVELRVWQRLLGEQHLARCATTGIPQEVSNVVLALARLGIAAPPVVSQDFAQDCVQQVLAKVSMLQLKRWSAQAVGNVMWGCGKLQVSQQSFYVAVEATAADWVPQAAAAALDQVAFACGTLQLQQPQLMALMTQRACQLLSSRKSSSNHGRQMLAGNSLTMSTPAYLGWAVAVLDIQQLAGDVRGLVVNGVKQSRKMTSDDARMLWVLHNWLVQQQLLDGKGLTGVLSEQQLIMGEQAMAEAV
jgi:hypothetical protein